MPPLPGQVCLVALASRKQQGEDCCLPELGWQFGDKTLDSRLTWSSLCDLEHTAVLLWSPFLPLLNDDNCNSSLVGRWEHGKLQVCLEQGTWGHPRSFSLPHFPFLLPNCFLNVNTAWPLEVPAECCRCSAMLPLLSSLIDGHLVGFTVFFVLSNSFLTLRRREGSF